MVDIGFLSHFHMAIYGRDCSDQRPSLQLLGTRSRLDNEGKMFSQFMPLISKCFDATIKISIMSVVQAHIYETLRRIMIRIKTAPEHGFFICLIQFANLDRLLCYRLNVTLKIYFISKFILLSLYLFYNHVSRIADLALIDSGRTA